jgi:4-aminobutyrate aminotransferase-like enzyme
MHGRTSLAENLKGNTLMNGGWASKDWNVECMEFPNNNTPFLGFRKPEDVAGVIIESYQGWSARFFNPKFIQDLVKYCKEHDILVCFDEIQGGFGRTGKMFAYEHYGIERPDLICIGKGVSSSLPLSGVIGRADLIDLPEMGSMSSTHSANPLSCIAGLKNLLEIHDKHLVQQSHYLGDILHSFLRQKFGKKYEINGEGLLLGLITETEEEATQIVWECFKRGLLTIWTHKNSVKLAPPLTITEAELAEGLGVLNEVLLMRA